MVIWGITFLNWQYLTIYWANCWHLMVLTRAHLTRHTVTLAHWAFSLWSVQITRLSLVGGTSSERIIQWMLTATLNNGLAYRFNWAGKGPRGPSRDSNVGLHVWWVGRLIDIELNLKKKYNHCVTVVLGADQCNHSLLLTTGSWQYKLLLSVDHWPTVYYCCNRSWLIQQQST